VITLESVSDELFRGIERALPGWIERHVQRLLIACNRSVDDEASTLIADAVGACAADVLPQLRTLFATDIDLQRTNPLAIARRAVVYPTRVLSQLGVPEVQRDEFAERNFPNDVYNLAPATFADVDPELHDLGIAWGAAKAYTHLQRRRKES